MKKSIVIAVLAAAFTLQLVFDLSPAQMGYFHGCAILNRVWFPLFHANVWHLIVNCYAACVCLNARMLRWRLLLPFLLAASFAASWVSNMSAPTVGASAAIYAMMGLNMSGCRKWKYWGFMAMGLAVGFLLPSVNGVVHVATFAVGFAAGWTILLYRRLCDDHRAVNC